MCPVKKKHSKAAIALLCSAALWNCSNETATVHPAYDSTKIANVALKLAYSATPLLDSLVLDGYGTDTVHYVHSTENPDFNMELFPSDSWKFKAKIYANGALMQKGEIETKLEAGTTTNLSIQMHPIVGFVYVEIPLGLKNEIGIAGGQMVLTSEDNRYEILATETTTGISFKSDMLPLGVEYGVQISLFDYDNNAIYSLSDKFLLTEDSPVPDFTLNSLRSKVSVSIQAAQERLVEITIPLKAGFRTPHQDDLLITEYFSAPDKSDSTQFEFVEIYNGSLDTLILDDCTIGLTSSSSMRHIPLTASEIAPRQTLVLGDPGSENINPLFINTDGWYAMGNSKGSVVLKCNGETIDSLYYASEPDSLHTNVVPALGSSKYGLSAQLNMDAWKNRADSSAWKLEKPTPGMI